MDDNYLLFSAVPQSSSYCYNIKEELREGKKNSMPFRRPKMGKKKSPVETKGFVNNKLANSPRFRPKAKMNTVSECENSNKKPVFPKVSNNKNSDNEYSDIKTEDEETPIQKPKPAMLWKKVSKNVEEEASKKEVRMQLLLLLYDLVFKEKKDPWKDLGTLIMEERYKAEERKEIIGEEWRKISRIFDRLKIFEFFS